MEQSESPASTKSTSKTKKTGERTFVLDTSVLLSDPKAMFRFAEHHLCIGLRFLESNAQIDSIIHN